MFIGSCSVSPEIRGDVNFVGGQSRLITDFGQVKCKFAMNDSASV